MAKSTLISTFNLKKQRVIFSSSSSSSSSFFFVIFLYIHIIPKQVYYYSFPVPSTIKLLFLIDSKRLPFLNQKALRKSQQDKPEFFLANEYERIKKEKKKEKKKESQSWGTIWISLSSSSFSFFFFQKKKEQVCVAYQVCKL